MMWVIRQAIKITPTQPSTLSMGLLQNLDQYLEHNHETKRHQLVSCHTPAIDFYCLVIDPYKNLIT